MTYFLVITRSSCAHDLIHGAIFILPCPIRGSVQNQKKKKNLTKKIPLRKNNPLRNQSKTNPTPQTKLKTQNQDTDSNPRPSQNPTCNKMPHPHSQTNKHEPSQNIQTYEWQWTDKLNKKILNWDCKPV